MTKAELILDYHYHLQFKGKLPEGISWLNPFADDGSIKRIIHEFYRKFYNDTEPRTLILGINPGRLGAGATGIPFTDTKRLKSHCGIQCEEFKTHEPSSVFIYDVVEAYGGAAQFYKDFYINSVCPLGFVLEKNNKKINFNYYDSRELLKSVEPFIIKNIKSQIEIAGLSERVYCLGTGKNYHFLSHINDLYGFFKEIIPLEHPRFIMQYKNKEKESYIKQYLNKLHLSQRKY